jgi:hypothetical protein
MAIGTVIARSRQFDGAGYRCATVTVGRDY